MAPFPLARQELRLSCSFWCLAVISDFLGADDTCPVAWRWALALVSSGLGNLHLYVSVSSVMSIVMVVVWWWWWEGGMHGILYYVTHIKHMQWSDNPWRGPPDKKVTLEKQWKGSVKRIIFEKRTVPDLLRVSLTF